MQAEVLPGWAEMTADAVGRAVENAQTSATPRRSTKEALFLARELHRAVLALRGAIREETALGVETKSFATEFTPVARAFDDLLLKIRSLLDKTPRGTNGAVRRRLTDKLRVIETEVIDARQYLAKYLNAARKPLPPLDQESLRRGREDAAAGRMEDVRDVIGRLEAGGDL